MAFDRHHYILYKKCRQETDWILTCKNFVMLINCLKFYDDSLRVFDHHSHKLAKMWHSVWLVDIWILCLTHARHYFAILYKYLCVGGTKKSILYCCVFNANVKWCILFLHFTIINHLFFCTRAMKEVFLAQFSQKRRCWGQKWCINNENCLYCIAFFSVFFILGLL